MFSTLSGLRHLRLVQLRTLERAADALRRHDVVLSPADVAGFRLQASQCVGKITPLAQALESYDRALGVVGFGLLLLTLGSGFVAVQTTLQAAPTELFAAWRSGLVSAVCAAALGTLWLGSDRVEYALELARGVSGDAPLRG